MQYANKAELMEGIIRKYHPEALFEGDIPSDGGEMAEQKQTEAKIHQPPISNRSRSRQPKPLHEQAEKKTGRREARSNHREPVTAEPVPQEASDGQI